MAAFLSECLRLARCSPPHARAVAAAAAVAAGTGQGEGGAGGGGPGVGWPDRVGQKRVRAVTDNYAAAMGPAEAAGAAVSGGVAAAAGDAVAASGKMAAAASRRKSGGPAAGIVDVIGNGAENNGVRAGSGMAAAAASAQPWSAAGGGRGEAVCGDRAWDEGVRGAGFESRQLEVLISRAAAAACDTVLEKRLLPSAAGDTAHVRGVAAAADADEGMAKCHQAGGVTRGGFAKAQMASASAVGTCGGGGMEVDSSGKCGASVSDGGDLARALWLVETVLRALDAGAESAARRLVLARFAEMCSDDLLAALIEEGRYYRILQIVETAAMKLRDCNASSAGVTSSTETEMLGSIVRRFAVSLTKQERRSSLHADMCCAFLKIAYLVPQPILPTELIEIVQDALRGAATSKVKAVALGTLPFLVQAGFQVPHEAGWIGMVHDALEIGAQNQLMAVIAPSVLASLCCCLCCRNPRVRGSLCDNHTIPSEFEEGLCGDDLAFFNLRILCDGCLETKIDGRGLPFAVAQSSPRDSSLHHCTRLTPKNTALILGMFRRCMQELRSKNTSPVSLLRALRVVLPHSHLEQVCTESSFLRDILNLSVAENASSTTRHEAARVIGALADDDGVLLMSMQNVKNLEEAVMGVRMFLHNVWSRGEPSDPKVSGRMEGCFLTLGYLGGGVVANFKPPKRVSEWRRSSAPDAQQLNLITPLILDLVLNCASCHEREQHKLVQIAFQSVELVGRALGGDVYTIIGDRIIKRNIYLKIVRILRDNDLLFASFFAVFHSIVNHEDLKRQLLNDVVPTVVPELIVLKEQDLISLLSSTAGIPTEEMILNVFPSIMTHLFFMKEGSKTPNLFGSSMELAFRLAVTDNTEEQSNIVSTNALDTLDMVMWEVCLFEEDHGVEHVRGVLSKICRFYCDPNIDIHMIENDAEPPIGVLIRNPTFKQYYSRLLHGYYTKYFKSTESCLSDQLHALRVVNYTIPLLGTALDDHYTNLESIIRSAQPNPRLREYVCRVWSTLIHSLGPFSPQIKANLTPILVNLMGLGQSFPHLVAPPMSFLLIKHKMPLSDLIKLVPILRIDQSLLQDSMKVLKKSFENCSLQELVERHLHGIECGDEIVQSYALAELEATLRAYRKEIAAAFMGDKATVYQNLVLDVKKLICALVRLTTMGRQEIRIMSSKCLGGIGAIDPARIGHLPRVEAAYGSKGDDDLAVELICSHLVRILKRAGSRAGAMQARPNESRITVYERVHWAIQMLLEFTKCNVAHSNDSAAKPIRMGSLSQHPRQIAECNSSSVHASPDELARGRHNWSLLPLEVQQVVKPFLGGGLVVREKPSSLPPYQPIYNRCMRLHEWACTLQRYLIQMIPSTRSEVFNVVKPLLKYDSALAVFLLPHTVFEVVANGTDNDREIVRKEILHVLEANRSQDGEEIDQGTILSIKEECHFKIASSQQSPLEPQEYVGKFMKVGTESRRIVRADAGGQLMVERAFPAECVRGRDSSQTYVVYSMSTGAGSQATDESAAEACGGTTIMQQVFGLMESLTKWNEQASLALKKSSNAAPAGGTQGNGSQQMDRISMAEKVTHVTSFLSKIPKRILAETCLRCGAYDRALLYLEISVREAWKAAQVRGQKFPPPLENRCDQDTVKMLQHIHAGLDDIDGLVGVAKLREKSTLEEQVLDSEIAGDWTAALACYEQASQEEPGAIKNHLGLLRCLRNLGHLQTMLTHAEGCIHRYSHESEHFRDFALQAAWRLGRWDLITELSARFHVAGGKPTFDYQLAHALVNLKDRREEEFLSRIRKARQAVLEPLAAASMESYHRAYPLLMRLQMVSELQEVGEVLLRSQTTTDSARTDTRAAMEDWDVRLRMTQPSLLGREPLLALRRVLFELLGMKDELANAWVNFARAARCAGHDRTAQSAIMQAERYGASQAHIERAKLKWGCPSERHECLRVLRDYIDRHRRISTRGDERIYTKTLVLYWRWVQEMELRQTSDIADKFQEEMKDVDGNTLCKQTEKTHFLLGHFYDLQVFPDRHTGSRYSENGASTALAPGNPAARFLPTVLYHYAQSLLYGYKHIFQSLPRLLTLWFEHYGSLKPDEMNRANEILRDLKDRLPPYIWLTVFSQLVSRICHPHPDILLCLKDIIAKVLHKHPKQVLWSLVSVLKSSQASRVVNAKDIRDRALKLANASHDSSAKRAMDDFLGRLVEELFKVCNLAEANKGQSSKANKIQTLSMSRHCKSLAALGPLDSVMVPLQTLLTPAFPADGNYDACHNPFPSALVTLRGFGDRIDVMSSLMSPVVVRFLGSDGKEHKFLCKPKDDLRKDSRMMDFNTVINRLLAKDADARRRNLYLRTFSVVPLNENNGLIQWVNGTTVLREILNDLYGRDFGPNIYRTTRIQEIYVRELKPKGPRSPVDLFEKVLLPQFPPVLHRWLLDTFPEPAAWVAARNAFTRTVAAWSMVGYVVGLGDRHAENIMFDATNGDCVHVDFSCLFNRGETLTVPERVPFRLTQNLLDPLGVCGHEGAFTRVSCVAMRVLRGNKDSLMNVLETFLHDPLVEWKQKTDEASRTLCKCERRLRGEVTRFPSERDIRQVLSVDGQVRAVIAEATSVDNLAQMYRWWMPWY